MELGITKTIQKIHPIRSKIEMKYYSGRENLHENLLINYHAELSHIHKLTFTSLKDLVNCDFFSPEDVLDKLYNEYPIQPKSHK